MIQITNTGVKEILRLRLRQAEVQSLVRLSLHLGGCHEWSYKLEFSQQLKPTDVVYKCDQIQIIIDEQALRYVEGLTIDYSEDLMGGGFRFHNPNASQTCGCSYSFSAQ